MEKKRYKSIIVDIDNTLTQLQYTVDQITEAHNMEPLNEEDITDFNFKNVLGITDEEDQIFWREHEEEIVDNVPYAEKRVSRIMEYIDIDYLENVYIVTNRPKELTENTKIWLENNNILYTSLDVIGKEAKAEVVANKYSHADAIFEDNPDVITGIRNQVETQHMDTWLIDYAYNRRTIADYVVSNPTGELVNR